jgi:kinetochore protein Spc7/SPC105
MTYLRDIELVFDVASFQHGQKNSQIDLWYIAANRSTNARPATAEREFFVQCIRDHIRALPQSRTKISDLLHMVRAGWDSALSTCDDIRRLNLTFPTRVARTSDTSVAVLSSLLLAPLQTKVEVVIGLEGVSAPDKIAFAVRPEAKVVYGEQFNVGKMTDFLTTHLGITLRGKDDERQSWSDVLVSLHEKLLARGRK